MQQTLATLLISCTVLVSSVAAGGDNPLDKPVTSQPTVRSEIKRGWDAAFDCGLKGGPFEIEAAADCFDAAQRENRQKMSTGYEPFAVGCYFGAWSHFRIVADVLKSHPVGNAATAEHRAEGFWKSYRENAKSLGLTDDDVLETVGAKTPLREKAAEARKLYGD
jgi:hypothetical protein